VRTSKYSLLLRWIAVGIVTSCLVCSPQAAAVASAQMTLSVQNNYFLVNGQPKFLVFISYFDALDSANPRADFQYFRAIGIDGIRVFPNWWTWNNGTFAGDTLMRPDGSLEPTTVQRMRTLLDTAQQEGLIVDISFSAETVSWNNTGDQGGPNGPAQLNYDYLRVAMIAAAQQFIGYRGVLFDLQNESNIHGPLGSALNNAQVAQLKQDVHNVDPNRIVTASMSQDWNVLNSGQATLIDQRVQTGLNVVAYHEPRDVNQFYTLSRAQAVISRLAVHGKPVYLQEPIRWRQFTNLPEYQITAAQFREAVNNAKRAGAAAWCFHQHEGWSVRPEGFYLNGTTLQYEVSLPGHEVNRDFLQTFKPGLDATPWGITPFRQVTLRTIQQGTYIVAEGGGGGAVNANRTAAAQWETFGMIDHNGGELMHGDVVSLRTYNGYYVQPDGGGGAGANATATAIGPWEQFIIWKMEGGSQIIGSSQWVAFKTAHTGNWWMVAEYGGGPNSVVNVNRTGPGAWETFQINFVGW
jgi:hypothetical protein